MHVHLNVFSYGGIEPETNDALVAEIVLDGRRAERVLASVQRIGEDALISRSRSVALSRFLASDSDVCFMVDHDIAWTPGALVATTEKAYELQAMVSGIYSTRGKKQGIAGRAKDARVVVRPGTGQLIEAEYLPGGFLAIPRVVAEEVLRAGQDPLATEALRLTQCIYNDGTPFHDFFRPIVVASTIAPGKFEYLSEDWSWSYRARQANSARKQWLWAGPALTHYGKWGFVLGDAERGSQPQVKY